MEKEITESNGGGVGNASSAIPDNCTRMFSPAPVTSKPSSAMATGVWLARE
ncbi:hypothetical protein [Paenibacillus sp. EKM212P]|uniref:hypothetical protein n=1 Tax=Paenibacillus sp. EKM212P TaxID=1683680 RepID=UPI001EEB8D8F|nr:hypothetical protein [Paenibacillus sp. EKM212P]